MLFCAGAIEETYVIFIRKEIDFVSIFKFQNFLNQLHILIDHQFPQVLPVKRNVHKCTDHQYAHFKYN